MQKIAFNIQQTGEICLDCGNPIFTVKGIPHSGVCLECGKKNLEQEEITMREEVIESIKKNRALNYFNSFSVFAGNRQTVSKMEIVDFKVVDDETKLAMDKVQWILNELQNHNSLTFFINGKTGTGKTHLAMGILNELMKQEQKVLFINYAEFLDRIKNSFDGFWDDKERVKRIQKEIMQAEVVVIDDLGAEMGAFEHVFSKERPDTASDFNIRTLNKILEARVGKSTIFTSNLTSQQIRRYYGERILSRILNKNYAMTFKQTKDKRGVRNV